jgi:hypothetical protein
MKNKTAEKVRFNHTNIRHEKGFAEIPTNKLVYGKLATRSSFSSSFPFQK